VVATSIEGEFRRAVRALEAWGPVGRTDYYNVLVVRVEASREFLSDFGGCVDVTPEVLSFLSRVIPCDRTFDFHDREDFEARASAVVRSWAGALMGQSFHVRMHRRGFKRQLSSQAVEQFLAEQLLGDLARRGAAGAVSFDDPDAIISVESVGGRAGLSLWTREDVRRYRYPFLGVN